MARKKPIISPLGQWAYPGEVTIIPSSKITMKGVNYPVLGVDDLGNSKVMMPGAEYDFPGNYVTEYPQMQFGGMSKRKVDKILNKNKDLNFVQRMYQPNTPSMMIPGQQHPSTHFMGSGDGRVYPTVVQMPDGTLQYLGDNAYDYADQTGQYIEFPNDRQARRFAKSYKKGTGVLEEFGKGGQMIKRKDGSYSQRGLWDNIRANKGSGKKPTKEMLEQERKIKAKMQNGGWLDQYQIGGEDIQKRLNRYMAQDNTKSYALPNGLSFNTGLKGIQNQYLNQNLPTDKLGDLSPQVLEALRNSAKNLKLDYSSSLNLPRKLGNIAYNSSYGLANPKSTKDLLTDLTYTNSFPWGNIRATTDSQQLNFKSKDSNLNIGRNVKDSKVSNQFNFNTKVLPEALSVYGTGQFNPDDLLTFKGINPLTAKANIKGNVGVRGTTKNLDYDLKGSYDPKTGLNYQGDAAVRMFKDRLNVSGSTTTKNQLLDDYNLNAALKLGKNLNLSAFRKNIDGEESYGTGLKANLGPVNFDLYQNNIDAQNNYGAGLNTNIGPFNLSGNVNYNSNVMRDYNIAADVDLLRSTKQNPNRGTLNLSGNYGAGMDEMGTMSPSYGLNLKYTNSFEDGGWLDEFQVGGIRRPIYTSNSRDPRIGRYTDSLNLYNKNTLAAYDLLKKYPKIRLPKVKNTFSAEDEYATGAPYGVDEYMGGKLDFYGKTKLLPEIINRAKIKPIGYQQVIEGASADNYFPVYKKPVQPYIYKKPVAPRVIPKPVLKPVIPKAVTALPVIPPPVASVPVVEPPVKKIGYSKPIIQQFNYMSNENKAKALQKYGSVGDIPFQGVDINQLKDGGWLDEFQVGGGRRPIYTSDLNDPRLQRFNDSASLHNSNFFIPNKDVFYRSNAELKKSFCKDINCYGLVRDGVKQNKKQKLEYIKGIQPTGYDNFPNKSDYNKGLSTEILFPEPVQPIIYQPSLAVSNIDRDMYTPGGGMAREYNIGVTLQDGSKKAFRTEKEYQDWKAANNLDITNAKVSEGRGYSYNYPENKKNGGWLNSYQIGGAENPTEWDPEIGSLQTLPIHKKRSWSEKLRGHINQFEKKIGLDPYNQRSDDFMEQWARRVNDATGGRDWYKQPNDASGPGGIATATMETIMAPFSAPQYATVYGATGKVQMPSEAMNIQNPYLAFLVDGTLDPTNVVGAGIVKNLGKGSLQNMFRSRMRGVRPTIQNSVDNIATPNISNQLPPPELGYINTEARPHFDEWMRSFNSNPTGPTYMGTIGRSGSLFGNPAANAVNSFDLNKLKKSINRSGLTKEDVLKNVSSKGKEALSKMSDSEFEQTVLKPTGEVVPYEPAINLGLDFNTNTRNLNLSDAIPMDDSEYRDIFNSRLDMANDIIFKNNKSGYDYELTGLTPGTLNFNTPKQFVPPNLSEKQIERISTFNKNPKEFLVDNAGLKKLDNGLWIFDDSNGIYNSIFTDTYHSKDDAISAFKQLMDKELSPQEISGKAQWSVGVNPGQWRGEVKDIANADYFKAIPGLDMSISSQGVFADGIPRRGTRAYESINEYLKLMDLGRVKPGFNSQTSYSKGLWDNAIKKGKAFGYFNNPRTIYGSMRTVAPLVAGATAASQLPEQKNGGWLNKYQEGGENLPELNSKIDIANFYKNPLSEKYGIYQDPEDDTYKYYLKTKEAVQPEEEYRQLPDLSNIDKQKLKEINAKKASLSEIQLSNIQPVSPVILPKQRDQILRDKLYYEQDDLMEQAISEFPIPSVKTPTYSEMLDADPEFKRVMTEKPKPVAPIKPKPVATNTPLVPIGNAPRAIVRPAVRKVVAKNDIVNLADLTITAADKAYLNKVDEYCPGGNCLETTRNAYDMLPGRIPGIPTTSAIWSEDLKVHSKKGTPTADDIKKYPYFAGDSGSGTLDSWDAQGRIVETGGKNFYNINTPTPINYKEIPVGALIGWGPKNQKNSNDKSRNQGYNIKFGMQPSHHSTMVVGYSEDGEPIVYDGFLEKYMTLTEAKANIGSRLDYELENISAPKSVLNNTQDNLKNQGILLNYIPPTNINPNKILSAANQPWAQIQDDSIKRAPRFNKQMMTEFNSALINNKGELMRNLNISSEKYEEFSKILLAISAQESEGGGALKLFDNSSVGMTQLLTDNIFTDDKLKKAAAKPYMLNDGTNNILSASLIQKSPSASAVASMIYLSQLEKSAQAKYAEGKIPKERSVTKINYLTDILRSNTAKYNSDGFFVEEVNKRIDLSPFEGGMFSDINPVGAAELLNKTAGTNRYKVEVKDGDLVIKYKTKGNANLSNAEIIAYGWQSLNTLKSGDAQGDSIYTRRVKNYYDLLNNTTPTYRKEGGQTDWLNKYK